MICEMILMKVIERDRKEARNDIAGGRRKKKAAVDQTQ